MFDFIWIALRLALFLATAPSKLSPSSGSMCVLYEFRFSWSNLSSHSAWAKSRAPATGPYVTSKVIWKWHKVRESRYTKLFNLTYSVLLLSILTPLRITLKSTASVLLCCLSKYNIKGVRIMVLVHLLWVSSRIFEILWASTLIGFTIMNLNYWIKLLITNQNFINKERLINIQRMKNIVFKVHFLMNY